MINHVKCQFLVYCSELCLGGYLMDLIADGCLYRGFKLKTNQYFSLINEKNEFKTFFIFLLDMHPTIINLSSEKDCMKKY